MSAFHIFIVPGLDGGPPQVHARTWSTENHPEVEFTTAIHGNTDTAMVARAMLQAAAYLFAQGQPVRFADNIPREVLK